MRCQAKAKSTGDQCRRWAVTGRSVCQVHGGVTPRGPSNPHFKHGRYSRDLPTQLAARYADALTNTELLSLRDDIALITSRVTELLENLPTDPAVWETIQERLESRRKLVDSERGRLFDLQQVLTAEQAMALLAVVVDTVKRHVSDRATLAAISADISRMVERDKYHV